MQVIIKASGERRADSCDLVEIRHARAHDALQATEVLEQRPSLRGPESRDGFQHRLVVAARAALAMSADREAVSLIAYALNEPCRRRVALGRERCRRAVHEEPLLTGPAVGPLRDPDEGEIAVAEPGEHLVHLIHLARTAVDQDEIRCGHLPLAHVTVAPLERLAQSRVVISRRASSAVEPPLFLLDSALLTDYHDPRHRPLSRRPADAEP